MARHPVRGPVSARAPDSISPRPAKKRAERLNRETGISKVPAGFDVETFFLVQEKLFDVGQLLRLA